MTEIKCIECGTSIGDGLTECPNCGCPIEVMDLKSEVNVGPTENESLKTDDATSTSNETAKSEMIIDDEATNIDKEPAEETKQVKKTLFTNGAKTQAATGNQSNKKKYIINVPAIISMVIGIVIIAIGFNVKNTEINELPDTYSAQSFDVTGYSFGADFYTEIYGAVDTVADELDAVNSGIASVSDSMNQSVKIVSQNMYIAIGVLVIALGLTVVSFSVLNIVKKE